MNIIIPHKDGSVIHIGPCRVSPGVAILVERAPEPNAATAAFRHMVYDTGLGNIEHGCPVLVDDGWVVYGRAW